MKVLVCLITLENDNMAVTQTTYLLLNVIYENNLNITPMKFGIARDHEGTYKLDKKHSECKNLNGNGICKGLLKAYKYRQHLPSEDNYLINEFPNV
jgi:hypothetical protein